MLSCLESPPVPPESWPLARLLEERSVAIVYLRRLDELIRDARDAERGEAPSE